MDNNDKRRKYKRLNKTIMNENLNLVEILKDCPKGTKLYSLIYGDVELEELFQDKDALYPIRVKLRDNALDDFTKDGRVDANYSGECIIFPSREQRNWDLFTVPGCKKGKFDPKTLRPFDRVLVRDKGSDDWTCGFFSHKGESMAYPYRCVGAPFICCIPYNEDTKHLVGTTDEAPEYYRYWED